jgi:hypothetical protein
MDDQSSDPRRQVHWQYLRVQAMRRLVFSPSTQENPPDLIRQLAEEEAQLLRLDKAARVEGAAEPAWRGGVLGEQTTGLEVKTELLMQPLPTGMYHLLDPLTEPLLAVTVRVGPDVKGTKRVCVKAYLEGLSAQAVRTVEIPPGEHETFKLLPTLFPEQARALTEIQRATLHVLVEDLDAVRERHDTFSVVCLSRNSSFNTVRRPALPGQPEQLLDLTRYYGAWVTPHVEEVQRLVQRASQFLPARELRGYFGADPGSVTEQVKALFQALKEEDLTYVNSAIDYGAPEGTATQRTRLPRETLANGSANCMDGTVLMASLIEGASLDPALVLLPGHAFVGWDTGDDSDPAKQWRFLETTMIADATFEAACQTAQRWYDEHRRYYPDRLKMHRLSELRARGIWPME